MLIWKSDGIRPLPKLKWKKQEPKQHRERDKERDVESEHVPVYLCASCLRVAVAEAMFTTSFPLV